MEPAATAGLCCAGAGVLAAADPATHSWYPPCTFHSVTGWWCPGCGLTRALAQVVRGHPIEALGSNLWWPLVVLLAATGWWTWARRARGHQSSWWASRVPTPAWATLAVAVIAFAVVRNLPGEPWTALAP